MTTTLLAAVLLLSGMALWGVKIIATTPNQQSTPAYAFLGVSVVLAMKILLSMLQTEFARRDIRADIQQTRHDLRGELHANNLKMDEVVSRTNGGLTKAVREVAQEVAAAERDQIINDPEQMQKLARELCPMLARDIAAELRKQQPPTPPVHT